MSMVPICENCVKGHRLPGKPTGTMITVGGFDTYFAGGPEASSVSGDKKAIVLFTDIFGLPLGNPQIMADEFAQRVGCDVYVPDMFNGSPPVSNESLEPYETVEIGGPRPLWKKLGFLWTFLRAIPNFMFGNRPTQAAERMKKFVEALKAEKGVTRIGAVGYCYGGTIIIRLAPFNFFTTAVIAHPGKMTDEDFGKIQHPTSFACAEEDESFGPARAREVEAVFASRKGTDKVDYEFHEYKGTKHGFAARPALEYPALKKAFEGAKEQTVAWFQKTL